MKHCIINDRGRFWADRSVSKSRRLFLNYSTPTEAVLFQCLAASRNVVSIKISVSSLSYGATAEHFQLVWLKHGSMCAEGVWADGTCLRSLTQRNETGMRFTRLQARLRARNTLPTHAGGIFSLFKDNEMTMYSTVIRYRQGEERLGGVEWGTFCSTCLLPLIRQGNNSCHFCICVGLMKAQLTTLST